MKRILSLCAFLLIILLVLPGCFSGLYRSAPSHSQSIGSGATAEESLSADPESEERTTEASLPDAAQSGVAETLAGGIAPPESMPETAPAPELPDGFSYISDINPNISVDLKYAGKDNFTGEPVDGYYSNMTAILRTEAAEALSKVQEELAKSGYGLLIYDAYRPAKAVSFFVRWSQTEDERTKEQFYPNLNKPDLFKSGYISSNSAHSCGSTVDLTIITIEDGIPLDMGTNFDFLDSKSHHGAAGLTAQQEANRALLLTTMAEYGFASYSKEWWHYSFPVEDKTAYDFDVR